MESLTLMQKLGFSKQPETKDVIQIASLSEVTREGLHKAYIPKFLYKPPFGYPRMANLSYVRWLATTPYVEMCIQTILDELSSVEWDVVIEEGFEDKYKDAQGNITEEKQKELRHVKDFFENPNTNEESFDEVFIRMPIRDLLEVNSGVLIKVFNLKGDLVEVTARDGATFTKNPDIRGMFTDRDEIIFPPSIVDTPQTAIVNPFQQISSFVIREIAAYFQYGWLSGPIPVPFGKREIIWLERMKRTDDHYGFSAIQVLAKNLQMLLYMIDSDLDYYNENNVPKGIIGLDQSDDREIKAFKQQWLENQQIKDDFGNYRKLHHRVPILNTLPHFERIEFSSTEMQVIEKQRWYTKMVWACFGVTATELGYTEDAKGQANQIVQSKVFRKKAINPILRLLETKYNKQIVSEFGYEHVYFKPKLFDIDEEKNRAELYKIQVETGIMTVNEIRQSEGLDPVDWGDEPPKSFLNSPNSFNFGNESGEKPFSKKEEEAAQGEKFNSEKIPKTEEKALGVDDPLLLREGESITEQKFMAALKFVLAENEKKLKKAIEKQTSLLAVSEIKSLEDVINGLKAFLSFEGLKSITKEGIKQQFMKGWDSAEKELDMNLLPNQPAIDFIQNYTFENVKGMTEDIANKLKGELSRGFMENEGVDKLKARITSVFDVVEPRAEAIARTEFNRAQSKGRLLAVQKSGKVALKWLQVTHDNRTSEISKALSAKYGSVEQAIPVDEEFSVVVNGKTISGQSPPFHVNERDRLMFTFNEDQ